MRRRAIAIVVGALILLGLGAFAVSRILSLHNSPAALITPKASTCVDAYRLLKLTPSQITAANQVCLKQTLQLSGEVVGSVGQAYPVDPNGTGPVQQCSEPKRWDGYPQARLAFVVAGRGYRLRISPPGSSEHQAVTLNNLANVIELASIADPSQDWSQATGSVRLNPDGISGTLDADVLQDVAGAQPVHISGKWACGTAVQPQAFDASAPCASFYALNQLAADDVSRMKASACHAEDMTFSGDISAHLDHAITDSAISPHAGFGGDNFCSAANEVYEATLKFSIGDESFLLNLQANQYPAVTPGKYSAQTSGVSIGAVLFLGHADAGNHGEFVTDDQVMWLGASGSFTVAPGLKSGAVDATLRGTLEHSSSTIHIVGSWRCG